jgi:TrpR-related protein YerC/YecD
MAKFSLNKLPEKQRIEMIAEFYDTIHSLKGRDEVRLFFRDLLMPDEIAMLMRRVEIAVLLQAGFTYEQISELLGVGKGKITNVQKSFGRHGEGYKVVIQRILERRKSKIQKAKKRAKVRQSDFERMKQRYSGSFLLLNLIDELGERLDKDKYEKEALEQTSSRRK